MSVLPSLAAVFYLVACADASLELEKVSNCSARFANGTLLDLTGLVGSEGRARFRAVEAPDESVYYYDPCDSAIADVTVADSPCCGGSSCICYRKANHFINIGDISTAEFHLDEETDTVFIEYSHDLDGIEYRTTVRLECVPDLAEDEDDALGVGILNGTNISLTLTTTRACALPQATLLSQILPLDDGNWWKLNVAASVMALCSLVGVIYIVFGLFFVNFREGTTGKELIVGSRLWKNVSSIPNPWTAKRVNDTANGEDEGVPSSRYAFLEA